jgi:hypothetical protein
MIWFAALSWRSHLDLALAPDGLAADAGPGGGAEKGEEFGEGALVVGQRRPDPGLALITRPLPHVGLMTRVG